MGGASTTALAVRHPRAAKLRVERGLAAVLLAGRGGARYVGSAPRLFTAAGENREQLRNDLALRTAEDVAATLGTMKGVLMKLGQMASYVDRQGPGAENSPWRCLSAPRRATAPQPARLIPAAALAGSAIVFAASLATVTGPGTVIICISLVLLFARVEALIPAVGASVPALVGRPVPGGQPGRAVQECQGRLAPLLEQQVLRVLVQADSNAPSMSQQSLPSASVRRAGW